MDVTEGNDLRARVVLAARWLAAAAVVGWLRWYRGHLALALLAQRIQAEKARFRVDLAARPYDDVTGFGPGVRLSPGPPGYLPGRPEAAGRPVAPPARPAIGDRP